MTQQEQRQFYLDNCNDLTYAEMRKGLGIGSVAMTKLMKDNNFPKKPLVFKKKQLSITFFSWEWAATIDPLMC